MRERFKVTETQRMQNSMAFNKAEEQLIDGNVDIVGMLDKAAEVGGRLRSLQDKTRQKRLRLRAEKSGTVTGLTTSAVFTAVQGIELSNPEIANQAKRKQSKYFKN